MMAANSSGIGGASNVEEHTCVSLTLCVCPTGVRRTKMVALAEQYLKAVQSASQAVLEVLTPHAILRPSSAAPAPKRTAATAASVAAVRRAAAAAAYEEEAEPGTIQQSGVLPPSILANREPYRHGEWRRQPFVPRSGPC
jgi:hypothetical protein